jgi:hypothetical protein
VPKWRTPALLDLVSQISTFHHVILLLGEGLEWRPHRKLLDHEAAGVVPPA